MIPLCSQYSPWYRTNSTSAFSNQPHLLPPSLWKVKTETIETELSDKKLTDTQIIDDVDRNFWPASVFSLTIHREWMYYSMDGWISAVPIEFVWFPSKSQGLACHGNPNNWTSKHDIEKWIWMEIVVTEIQQVPQSRELYKSLLFENIGVRAS